MEIIEEYGDSIYSKDKERGQNKTKQNQSTIGIDVYAHEVMFPLVSFWYYFRYNLL